MSIVGGVTIFRNLNCFFGGAKRKKTKKHFEQELLKIQDETDIQVLPFAETVELKDIYSVSNHVKDYTIIIFGVDKNIVLCQDTMGFVGDGETILNKQYDEVLSGKNRKFFDIVMNMILSRINHQFLLLYNERLHFCNTFSYVKQSGTPIGGCVFLRKYSSLPEINGKYDLYVQPRKSVN